MFQTLWNEYETRQIMMSEYVKKIKNNSRTKLIL